MTQEMLRSLMTHFRDIWNEWNIRGVILLSLSFQALLIFVAPFRKATGKTFPILLVWCSYLMADWAANFCLGLISDSQKGGSSSHPQIPTQADILAFWAPFLLLHLGGPDTITALALEDNELWLRHLLALFSQAAGSIYVFTQSLPDNILWIPTILMFVAGVIKYVERTRALFLASLDHFRDSMLKEPDPGPNYAKMMEEYECKKDAQLPTKIIYIPEPDKENKTSDKLLVLTDTQIVLKAYKFFNIFKGLVVDLIFSFRERNESRDFFRRLDAETAMRVIEVELNFIYEVMYTKVQVVQTWIGYSFRVLASVAVFVSLGLFYFKVPKKLFEYRDSRFDVRVTYTLLLGAIALDLMALLMLVFSDWTLTKLGDPDEELAESKPVEDSNPSTSTKPKPNENSSPGTTSESKQPSEELSRWAKVKNNLVWFYGYFFLKLRKPWWRESRCHEDGHVHWVLTTPILFRRWSGCVSGHNLIRFCLKGRPQPVHDFTGWTWVLFQKIAKLSGVAILFRFLYKIYSRTIKETVDMVVKFVEDKFPDLLKRAITPISAACERMALTLRRNLAKSGWTAWLLFVKNYVVTAVDYLLHLPSNLLDLLGLRETLDKFRYVSNDRITKELWTFIFHELKQKSDYADDPETAKRISAARGDWVLADTGMNIPDAPELMTYVNGVKYDEGLLLWHIATELCYNHDKETCKLDSDAKLTPQKKSKVQSRNDKSSAEEKSEAQSNSDNSAPASRHFLTNCLPLSQTTHNKETGGCSSQRWMSWFRQKKEEMGKREPPSDDEIRKNFKMRDYREISKTLSDYMMYLLVMQPTMMSAVAGIGKLRFRDTCAEAERFLTRRRLKPNEQYDACDQILKVNTEVKPVHVKGDRSKSVLFDACILAKKLNEDYKDNVTEKWHLLARMWVEIMSCAAAHCRASTHARELSKGGQLISFVWLLMAHFGLGDQFQINEGHARAKLVVGK